MDRGRAKACPGHPLTQNTPCFKRSMQLEVSGRAAYAYALPSHSPFALGLLLVHGPCGCSCFLFTSQGPLDSSSNSVAHGERVCKAGRDLLASYWRFYRFILPTILPVSCTSQPETCYCSITMAILNECGYEGKRVYTTPLQS